MKHPLMLYVIVASLAFIVVFLLVPLFRWLARRLDVVDRPGDARKIHHRIIPYLGGVPFYIAFLLVILAIAAFFPQYSASFHYPMCLIGTLIVLMGLYDDICDMSSAKKLPIEIVLCLLLFFWGYRVEDIANPFGSTWNVGWLAVIITPLWITGIINAVNFSDGLDGLAAGLVFICAATLFAISYRFGQVASCIMMAYLMGATLAFLRYNFNPASVFMGDAGALFLGFILGASTLIQQQKGVAVIALAVPMVVMAIPLLDTYLSFLRRLQRARQGRFFTPDRNHLHHRLLDLGLTQKQVVLSMYYLSACMGILAFLLSVTPSNFGFLILLMAAMAIFFGVLVLRFIEALGQQSRREER